MPAPVVIPLPENFPITWDPPEFQHLPFQQDRQHVPLPMTHMSAWFAANGFAVGASRALAAYSVPMAFTVAHLNYYYYMAIAPNIPPEEMPAAEERAARSSSRSRSRALRVSAAAFSNATFASAMRPSL